MAEYLISELEVPEVGKTLIFKDKEARNDLSTAVVETAPSNPLTFTTRSAQNAQSAEIVLEPIQDLHGYDYPWPAGGGKNKLPMTVDGIKAANTSGTWSGNAYTVSGVAFTVETNDGGNVTGIKVNGTASTTITFSLGQSSVATGNYKLSGCTGGSSSTYSIRIRWNGGTNYTDATDGDVQYYKSTTYNEENVIIVRQDITLTNVMFYPMLRAYTETDATFAPYSNICPISGHTEVSLKGCGKNLFDVTKATDGKAVINDGSVYNINNYYMSEPMIVEPNTNYYILNGLGSGSFYTGAIYDKKNNFLRNCAIYGSGVKSGIINTGSNARYIILNGQIATKFTKPLMFCKASSATDYEPYVQSNNLTISFGEKVYGAKVELEKGTVTVTWGYIASYNGETLPGEWISDRDVYAPNTSPSTGAEVCYVLANPRTIQLTPNEISLLMGINNISTDGNSISLTYRDGKVATLGDLEDAANNLQEQIYQNETMKDETTQLLYKLGVNNGLLFMEEV